ESRAGAERLARGDLLERDLELEVIGIDRPARELARRAQRRQGAAMICCRGEAAGPRETRRVAQRGLGAAAEREPANQVRAFRGTLVFHRRPGESEADELLCERYFGLTPGAREMLGRPPSIGHAESEPAARECELARALAGAEALLGVGERRVGCAR